MLSTEVDNNYYAQEYLKLCDYSKTMKIYGVARKLWLQKELSLRELETKVNTNFNTIKAQVKELEYFGLVKVIKHDKSKINGRPFTSIKLVKN